jgi:type II secretory pathway component PulF
MAHFQYNGFGEAGQSVSGTIEAASEQLALEQLAGDGITPTDLRPGTAKDGSGADTAPTLGELWSRLREKRIPNARRAQFVNELATLVKADVPLLEALRVLGREEPHEGLRRILTDLQLRVARGEAFSKALAAHPRAFPNLLVTMVRVGETGGRLDEVLERMSSWMEHEEEVRGEVRGAMVYPCIVVLLAIVSVSIIVTVVLPNFRQIFAGMERQLPLPTRILLGFSDWARTWWWTAPLMAAVAIWGAAAALRNEVGRSLWDRFVLRIPIFGQLVLQSQLARFSAACGSLLATGVPLLETLRVVRGLVTNSQMAALVERVTQDVTKGEGLARSLGQSPWFPAAVSHLLGVGEHTGRLAEMFDRVARRFEKETRQRIRILINLLSPLLIVALAIVVGGIVASVLLPIYRMNELMR